ncbi:MAG: hypothetical protein ACRDSN_19745, partial [Pseudonocardiaceae bacterium]
RVVRDHDGPRRPGREGGRVTGPAVLTRVAFALRVHGARFGDCRRARPWADPPADLTLPPRTDPGC